MIVGTLVSFPGLGITVDVNPVAFTIGSFKIYWYGVLIALAMILCIVIAVKNSKAHNFPDSLVYDIMLVALPCAIVGARAYYVLCNWGYYSADMSRIIDTRSGGLAVYGGIIGAFLGVFIMCLIRKIPFTALVDYCIVYVPLGQAIGRWGNFFNQEAFGTTTHLPWGMTSATVQSYLTLNDPTLIATQPVHPTFLYESVADLIIFFVLICVRKRSRHAFETSAVYFCLYGIIRFMIEGLRTDSLYIGSTGIRISQALSLLLVIASLVYIAIVHIKAIPCSVIPAKYYTVDVPKAAGDSSDAVKPYDSKTAAQTSEESVSSENCTGDKSATGCDSDTRDA
ncbi:MAG: prolipoprotein diacylglyceryl transferase [Mageeibacillus sp.]|jgi:phosphatidylglycerol:prolipoprotein diacylglycerol transferase|nr:prolipoprotein diacylglyceryl transferase [Mageeibacillus sp.]MCI1264811.1 prolipoprotein diacylglyceryl transferase [Saccharofermentans sp.]MCI1769396.1 prolipoprotein diacylglyceryl transferase [Mageeibacillus sp.]MCI2044501.1 prolipoprotein diacylglyceryl transferase [Mageeibacillus sp.]